MRHRKAGSKFNRNSSHRKAMFRNMVTSLLKYERIKTTDQKAKALRGWADHIITLAKRGDLHARRQAMAIVREKAVVHKVFEEAPKRFATVSGGYTRVIKLGRRQGDAAMMSIVELVMPETAKPKTKKAAKKKEAAKQAPEKSTAKENKPDDAAADSQTVAAEAGVKEAQAETDAAQAADDTQVETTASDDSKQAPEIETVDEAGETTAEKDPDPEKSEK